MTMCFNYIILVRCFKNTNMKLHKCSYLVSEGDIKHNDSKVYLGNALEIYAGGHYCDDSHREQPNHPH